MNYSPVPHCPQLQCCSQIRISHALYNVVRLSGLILVLTIQTNSVRVFDSVYQKVKFWLSEVSTKYNDFAKKGWPCLR